MFPRLPSPLIRTHGSPLLRLLVPRRNGFPAPPPILRRLSHSLPPPNTGLPDPRLGFVRRELDELQSLMPSTPPAPELVRGHKEEAVQGGGGTRVELSHQWPEWVELMDRLLQRGYLDRGAFERPPPPHSSSSSNVSKDSNHIRTACLNFSRDRFDLIRYFSRRDIQIVVGSGCPSLDRKVVNSGKRLRAHVGIEEGDVCSSCNLRGSCERAYVKAREDEGGRSVDVMRILLTYGLDVVTGSVENHACLTKIVKGSVRKLLHEMVEFDVKVNSGTPTLASGNASSMMGRSSGHQMPEGQIAVPMRQGDWICPKCNFLNFAKNIKCLRCNVVSQERLKKLRDDSEHLPLKKGDWICEKCNFLNFAKNTKCLQCHEKPPKRQLNPGEWECVSCNYINFRRNMVCLKCDWKRPKASNSELVAESQHGEQGHHKHTPITSIRNSGDTREQHFVRDNCSSQEEDTDFWSSEGDQGDDEDVGGRNSFDEFDKFPIVGGKGATSQDPLARESWKEEMSRSRRGVLGKNLNEKKGDMSFARFTSTESHDSSGEDDIAGWFRYESGKEH